MPFRHPFNFYYTSIYKPPLEELGYVVKRADDVFSPRPIMLEIQHSILEADIILCEMSGRNPNVFYELGLAHAIGRPAILVSRKEGDIPFDLRHIRSILYDDSEAGWEGNLRSSIKNAALAVEAELKSWPPPLIEKHSSFLDRAASTERLELRRLVADAKHIDILGYSCVSILGEHLYDLANAVVRGAHVRILMVQPYSPAAKLMITHTFTRPLVQDRRLTQKRLALLRQEIEKAPKKTKGTFEVRYTSWIPSCGLTILNRKSSVGVIQIQIYPICHATLHTSFVPHQIVSRQDDGKWFGYFVQQYNRLWTEWSTDQLLRKTREVIKR
jgi:hypothetical protein